ncbi:hypothetical protein V1498_11645 [Peribacillus sp. SCS-26]|uniref:hypothetical protein n=1 Tax=Paraperibacillus marinus TaxID=3115295 RepID=UPI00390678E8
MEKKEDHKNQPQKEKALKEERNSLSVDKDFYEQIEKGGETGTGSLEQDLNRDH